jgi:hypothetical protein
MRYFFDLEFTGLQLISIGVVSEDGREFYCESCEVDWSKAETWILENVRPKLTGNGITLSEIREKLREFVGDDTNPEFWAYNGAYDWVIMTQQLFGRLLDIPNNWPKRHKEIKELKEAVGNPPLPQRRDDEHLSITDARWNKSVFDFLGNILEMLLWHEHVS